MQKNFISWGKSRRKRLKWRRIFDSSQKMRKKLNFECDSQKTWHQWVCVITHTYLFIIFIFTPSHARIESRKSKSERKQNTESKCMMLFFLLIFNYYCLSFDWFDWIHWIHIDFNRKMDSNSKQGEHSVLHIDFCWVESFQ